jgi:hypothetical protein
MTARRPDVPGVDRYRHRLRGRYPRRRLCPRQGFAFETHPNLCRPAADRLVPRRVIADREELGEELPGAAVRQPGPQLRQCPLVLRGAAVWDEFRCRAKRRPHLDRASAGFEARRRYLNRAKQRVQPPCARILQRAEALTVRAAAAQCAVLRDPGLNQVTLHAREQRLAVVQRQAERIERRMGSV